MAAPFAALALLSLAASPMAAQGPAPLAQVQPAAQSAIATRLATWVEFCTTTARPEYRADCLAERFDRAARDIGAYGETAELYRTLKWASRELTGVSQRYAAPGSRAVVLSSPRVTTSRPIRPVATANLAPATAAAEDIIQTAELTLLRSAGQSPDVVAFAEVAQILGSARVLLRSG